jgi:hypothetical protein
MKSQHPLANNKVRSLEGLISQFYHSMVVGDPVINKYGQVSIECADVLHHTHLINIAKNEIDKELENLEDTAQMTTINTNERMIEIG